MIYYLIVSAVLALVIYFLQSRYNVIEELRRPIGILSKIQEFPKLIIFIFMLTYFGIMLLYFWPAFLGDRPISGNHSFHFLKVHVLDQLINDWTIKGWTHKLFAGYPYGYFYSPIVELLTVGLNSISFGLFSLATSYSLMVCFTFLLKGISGFILGYKSFGMTVGFLAGLLLMLDPGALGEGGRMSLLEGGAWEIDLAISFMIIACAFIKDIWTNPSRRSFTIFTVFMSFGLLIHPISLLCLILVSITSLISYVATQNISLAVLQRAVGRYGFAISIGLLISAYFLLPYFVDAQYLKTTGDTWHSIEDIGIKITELSLFQNQNPVFLACGIIALVLFPFSNKFWPLFLATSVLFGLVLSSSDLQEWLPFLKTFERFSQLQLHNIAFALKGFFYCGAAFVLMRALSSLQAFSEIVKIESSMIRSIFRTAFVAILLGVLTWSVVKHVDFEGIGRKSATFASKVEKDKNMRKVIKWLKKKQRKEAAIDRTAIWQTRSSSHLLEVGHQIPQSIYIVGPQDSTEFKFNPESSNVNLLSHLQARYLVTDRKSISKKYYKRRIRYGKLAIYENKKWKRSPWRNIRGGGEIKNLKIKRESITFETSEDATGSAMLFVSYFPRWKLQVNGVEKKVIGQAYKGLPFTNFISFAMVQGKYKLEFKRNAVDYLSIIFSILGLALLFVSFFSSRFSYRVL